MRNFNIERDPSGKRGIQSALRIKQDSAVLIPEKKAPG